MIETENKGCMLQVASCKLQQVGSEGEVCHPNAVGRDRNGRVTNIHGSRSVLLLKPKLRLAFNDSRLEFRVDIVIVPTSRGVVCLELGLAKSRDVDAGWLLPSCSWTDSSSGSILPMARR